MIKKLFGNKLYFLIFFIILAISLYLRFHGYESDPNRGFGWDQARDAWKVRDILHGQLVLDGPKTGIGNLHLGPLYFYLLAPFYALTKLDPVGSVYFLFVANIINFFTIFFVTKRLFSQKWALFAVFLFGVSSYTIGQSMIPWNVSLVPATSAFIFYAIFQIKTSGKRYWYYILGILMGFFFHLHFTAVFFPAIVLLSLFPYDRKFKKLIPVSLTFLIAGLFLIPTVVFNYQQSSGELNRYADFFSNYTHGFYGRFFLLRFSDAFVQFKLVSYFPFAYIIQYVIPILFFSLIFFEKSKHFRLMGLLMLPWFLVPLLVFTLYAGPISDYYYYLQIPLVIFIIIYLQIKLLALSPKFLLLLVVFWIAYTYLNTQEFWVKPSGGGLNQAKRETLPFAKEGREVKFDIGNINSYLYHVWTEDYPPEDSVQY